jgi:hypothetical protein
MKIFKILTLLLGSFAWLGLVSPGQAAPTYTAVGINTIGNPRGYWEFLPTAYTANPTQKLPLVIFFHGLGEGGSGTVGTELNKVNALPPAQYLNTPAHSIRALIDTQGAIVLCPQNDFNTYWTDARMAPFISYALSHYAGRIDTRRIYFTGLSSGCSGIIDYMNSDVNPDKVTAFLACAFRGLINTQGAQLAKVCPFWGLTAIGDWTAHPDDTMDLMAGTLLGTGPTDCMATHPGGLSIVNTTAVYTGQFSPASGWAWLANTNINDGVNPKFTVLLGESHNSWDRTYGDVNTWNWLFAQQKPDLTITSPSTGAVATPGATINFTANAQDKNGATLTGSQIQWSSNLNGSLGSGPSLNVNTLSIGSHVITCQAIDSKYHGVKAQVNVSVPSLAAFSTSFDFGSPTGTTPGAWNNLTNPAVGTTGSIVSNAIDSTGSPVGVRVEIIQKFDGYNSQGVAASNLYPQTAQSETMYVASTSPAAQVRISGLNPAETYNFTFFASRSGSGDRTTVYTINGQSASLNAINNTTQTATLANLVPDSTGQLILTVAAASTSTFGYLGVMTIQTDGGDIPFFSQDFSSSSTVSSYVNATLTDDLFSNISAEVDGGTWSIDTGKLKLVRPGISSANNGAGFTRVTGPLASAPNVLQLNFKIALSGVNTFNALADLVVGDMTTVTDYNSYVANSLITNRLYLQGTGNGIFKFGLGTASSANLSANGADIAVSWFLNNSGSPTTYRGPDNATYPLNPGCSALWANGALLLNNVARPSGTTGTKCGGFRFSTGTSQAVTFKLDDFTVYDSLPQ